MTQTTKYYRDADGNYLGAWTTVRDGDRWVDHPDVPQDAIEVDQPPTDGRQKWDEVAGDWGPIPPTVPEFVTPLQARKALRQANLYDTVMAWIGQQSDEVQETWEYALEIRRDNPIIADAAVALGLTEQQVDALFILAATL